MTKRSQGRHELAASVPATSPFRRLMLSVLLFLTTILVYGQVWTFGFVDYDDPAYVTGNPPVLQGITLESVKWSWTHIHDSNWIPLTWLSLMFDTNLYRGYAGGYHLTNALLHAANTVILFLALASATANRARSAVVAALFALHPLHVESVAWVAERKDVLSTLFGLLSLLVYVRYAKAGGIWNLGASLLLFVASLLAKQTLVTLPFVFLLLDYWPLGRLWPRAAALDVSNSAKRGSGAARVEERAAVGPPAKVRLLAEKVPFFAVSVGFSVVALFAQSHEDESAVQSLASFPLIARCQNAIYVYVAYLQKTVFPQNLAVYYPHPHESLGWTAVGLSIAFLLAITFAAIAYRRPYPFVPVGWFWYLGTLVPMIGLVQIGSQQMADRYTYFPLIGIFLAVVWFVAELVPTGALRTQFLPAAVVAGLVLMAGTTHNQIGYWRESVALGRHLVDCTADNPAAHHFLARAYLAAGSPEEAIPELEKTLQALPDFVPARLELAGALRHSGRADDAMRQYERVLELDPRSVAAHSDLGLCLFQRQQYDDAVRHYRQALSIDPEHLPARINLAALEYSRGDYTAAIRESEDTLRRQPNLPAAQICLAMALREQGHLSEALRRLRQLVQQAPNDERARQELERTLALEREGSPATRGR
jgi:protein O-mannosyl-transferase